MKDIGLFFLNASVQAGYLTLALLLLRLIFKKAPKKLLCALWALVGLRLVLPVSLDSVFSLLPSRSPVTASGDVGGVFVQSGLPAVDHAANAVLQWAAAPTAATQQAAEAAAVDWGRVLTVIWLCGVALMLLYALISFLRLRLQVREAIPMEGSVRLCDRIGSPFILGVLRPTIYLPSDLTESDCPLILAHENAHLKRRDHIWKPLGFLLLTVYWFNPVLWVAYVLLCRDIELACDERVLQESGDEIKKSYAEALLRCSVPRHLIRACPVAFGETGVKQRIKSVLNYKKPAFWVIVLALLASAAVAVCFMTTPRDLRETLPDGMDDAIHEAILKDNEDGNWSGECATEGHVVYGCEQSGGTWKVYVYHGFERYGFINGCFTDVSGHWSVAVLTMAQTADGYDCKKIDYPEDGSYNAPSIRRMFPKKLESRALNPTQSDRDEVTRQCEAQAQAYLDTIGRDARIVPYNRLHLQLPNLSTEISNKLTNELGRMDGLYELTLGTREQLENGVRYVYRTSLLEAQHELLFTKERYDTQEVVESFLADTQTGEWLTDRNPLHSRMAQPPFFDAVVTEIRDGSVLVALTDDAGGLKKGTQVELLLKGTDWENMPLYDGSNLRVRYKDGSLMETYPLQLRDIVNIEALDAVTVYLDGTVTKIDGKWATVQPIQTQTQTNLPAAVRVSLTPTRKNESETPYEGGHYRIFYLEKDVTNEDPLTIDPPQAFYALGDINSQGNVAVVVPTTGVPEPTTRTSEPFTPPTTAKPTEPTATTKPTEPIWTTRAYTPEEDRAIRVLGEEAVERFPDLKNTTNSYLEKAYVLMNRYPKFKKANVKSYDLGQDGDGYQDVTLHTDKGDFKVKYDGFGCCVTNNQEIRETMGIPYYFPSISEPKNVQQLSLYYAFNYMMRDYPKFQGAFVDSFDQTVENDKITVTLHTDQGDCTVVMGATGKYISTKA